MFVVLNLVLVLLMKVLLQRKNVLKRVMLVVFIVNVLVLNWVLKKQILASFRLL